MKALIQRVKEASVTIDGQIHGSIGHGLLILLGVGVNDDATDATKLASRIPKLRIFNDENGLMNLSCGDVQGEYLVISQFTLLADSRKGNRPSYIQAARPEQAVPLYELFVDLLKAESGKEIKTGVFGADMKVSLVNDGPVTIMMDTKE
ncbi:MAG: D-aminoacyl-tRNA deacylase [Bacteroidota bacterium]|jgi:D-tyrosyl-tRNA(Tyr) deacylase